jgi:hypothetical protein
VPSKTPPAATDSTPQSDPGPDVPPGTLEDVHARLTALHGEIAGGAVRPWPAILEDLKSLLAELQGFL